MERILQENKSVLFALYPEWGGFMPMMALAKAFSRRGWDVLFVLPPEGDEKLSLHSQQVEHYKKYIEEQGFQYKLLRPFPKRFGGMLTQTRRETEILANILEDTIKIIKECNVGLVLIDSIISFVAIAAIESGVPYVGVGTAFAGFINSKIPPSDSSFIPDRSSWSSLIVLLDWMLLAFVARLFITFRPKYFLRYYFGIGAFVRSRARAAGLTVGFSDYGPMFKSPLHYLMPKRLDFEPRPGAEYLGCVVDLSRADEDFKMDRLSGTKPLIYCSLGTRSWEYPASKRFFRVALKTFQQRQDYEFVLNIGNTCEVEDLGEIPDNVYACKWVPQMAVLRKSSMMITNGGMNTIKECICLGVPMIVLPARNDQPGNAARVVYHGLGVRGDLRWIEHRELSRLINQISSDKSYIKNIKQMQKEFMRLDKFETGIDLLESYIAA